MQPAGSSDLPVLDGAEAVEGGPELEPARARVVANVPPGVERVQPLLVETLLDPVEHLSEGDAAVHARVAREEDRVADRPRLALVGKLMDGVQCNVLVSEAHDVLAVDADLFHARPVPLTGSVDRVRDRCALSDASKGPARIKRLGQLAGLGGHVGRSIVLLHDHEIRHVEVVPTTADDHDRRHAHLDVELAHLADVGRDGLLGGRHELHHALVAHHEVSRRRVLVDQHHLGAHLERLKDIGRLARRPRGVGRAEVVCLLPEGQVVDEGRDVDGRDAAAVLSADRHR
mmetsp:Transcript_46005/g.112051  ORF Transcript_46005/g.112051 Transcript_46005/m.112051 type:complete len:287 (+) Transcript_46005:686-1546(+)